MNRRPGTDQGRECSQGCEAERLNRIKMGRQIAAFLSVAEPNGYRRDGPEFLILRFSDFFGDRGPLLGVPRYGSCRNGASHSLVGHGFAMFVVA